MNNDSKELTDFLDKYGVYKVVDNRVDADKAMLAFRCITQLPESIGNLNCKELILSYNNLTSLPDNAGNLKCKRLFLHNNNLTQLPESIGNLKCEYFSLNDNNLTQLPDRFGNLKCKELDLSSNELTTESIELLHKLKSNGVSVIYQPTKQTNNGCKTMNKDIKELTEFLDKYKVNYEVAVDRVEADTVNLDDRGITRLPDSIGHLKCEFLSLNNNQLTSLPDGFGHLQCEYLGLDNNQLTSLPDGFWNLKCKELYLDNNQLTSLPDGFGHLQCEYLYLDNNPLTAESIELLEKLKSNGVTVIYQQTKQTNIGCKIITNCTNMADPDHYKKGAFQTIDVIEEFLDNESGLLTAKQKYSIGNAIKYLSRAGLKGSTPEDAITDLKKAENYIHRAITGEWIKYV